MLLIVTQVKVKFLSRLVLLEIQLSACKIVMTSLNDIQAHLLCTDSAIHEQVSYLWSMGNIREYFNKVSQVH